MAPTKSSECGCQCGPYRFLLCSIFYKEWCQQQDGKSWWKGKGGGSKEVPKDTEGSKEVPKDTEGGATEGGASSSGCQDHIQKEEGASACQDHIQKEEGADIVVC